MKLFDNRMKDVEEYLSKHRKEGRIDFQILTTGSEIIIYPNEGRHEQLRIKAKLWKA